MNSTYCSSFLLISSCNRIRRVSFLDGLGFDWASAELTCGHRWAKEQKYNSLFWGICQVFTIHLCVNAKDQSYQRTYREFIVRLVQARKDAGLTQVEVARKLGKANSFISKCELGERRVDFVELQQLAKIYEKDLSFFTTHRK